MADNHTYDKGAWRKNNLEWILRQHKKGRDRKLDGGYIEMLGSSGREMFEMMKGHLTSPQSFIGVNNEANIAWEDRERCPPYVSVLGDFFSVARDMAQEGKTNIYNLDGTWSVCGNFDNNPNVDQGFWVDYGENLKTLVEMTLAHHQKATLIINATLDLPKQSPRQRSASDRLQDHARLAQQYFEECPQLLSPSEDLRVVDDTKYLGQVGAFEIYRSKPPHILRMCTLRLTFQRRGRSRRIRIES